MRSTWNKSAFIENGVKYGIGKDASPYNGSLSIHQKREIASGTINFYF